LANSLVGKSTKTLGGLPHPVFLEVFAGPFVRDSKMGKTKARVLPRYNSHSEQGDDQC